ncbi:DUF4935 domain-containing protein [Methylovulum psychrotolerans]|uniref:PIN domain-containing protein n=1 Tax=Methylovulum psychrotolerans TaxID=1704499 RepID=UPI001BFF8A9B|nr:PIN domain-containing protein [Methylovulum psychrotolerans]MBT9097087.1 DUF4935 domain-containing protein [Methylovulum psychrotolerans]
MFVSPAAISQDISRSTAPLLFFDTCIFLDILRSPYRENISVRAISSALHLLKIAEQQPHELWLLASETVQYEWRTNIGNVRQELEKEIKKLEHGREKLVAAANVVLAIDHAHGHKIIDLDLPGHLERLSENLLNHCLLVKQENVHALKAMDRVVNSLPPSKQGKEVKDCLIFEAFLDVAEQVRNLGYNGIICFVTANTNDYGKPGSSLIVKELQAVNAVMATNLEWALVQCQIAV